MSVLYVTETGAQVRREGERLTVWKGKKKLHTSSAYDLHQMVLFGNIGITPAAMHTALMQGIDLVLLSTTGSYRGRLVGPQGRNIILRQMQYRRYEDENLPKFNICNPVDRYKKCRIASVSSCKPVVSSAYCVVKTQYISRF